MKEYYYNLPDSQEKAGPVGEEALRAGAKDGTYPPGTLVWCHGMETWTPMSQVLSDEELPPLPRTQTECEQATCPPNHLVGAVIITAFNFLFFPPFCILGIFAIVKASNVEPLWRQGQKEEAERASRAAHTLNKWSLFLLLLPLILLGLLFCSIALSFA